MKVALDFLLAVDQYISDVYKDKTVDETALQAMYAKLIGCGVQEKLEAQLKV